MSSAAVVIGTSRVKTRQAAVDMDSEGKSTPQRNKNSSLGLTVSAVFYNVATLSILASLAPTSASFRF